MREDMSRWSYKRILYLIMLNLVWNRIQNNLNVHEACNKIFQHWGRQLWIEGRGPNWIRWWENKFRWGEIKAMGGFSIPPSNEILSPKGGFWNDHQSLVMVLGTRTSIWKWPFKQNCRTVIVFGHISM